MNSTHTPAPDGEGGIFISYSHKDKAQVIPQVEAMRAHGYRVWYDANITPGDQWTDTIAEEIENCAIFLPFLSDSFPQSKICMREFRYANSCTKRIVPVWLVDKHRLSGKLRFQLEDYQGYTLTESSPDAVAAWMDTQKVFTSCRTAARADTAARTGYAADTAGRVRRPAQTFTQKPVEPSESFVGREDVLHRIATTVRRRAPLKAETVDVLAGQLAGEMEVGTTESFTQKLWVMELAAALHRVAEALSLQTENYGWMLHQMGYLTAEQGNYDAALEWYHKALRIRETVLGQDHPDTADTYNNIALVYYYKDDYDAALKWYQKDLRISEKVLGQDHPHTATTYNNIAGVYYKQGNYDAALKWYHKALRIKEAVLGQDHPSTATTYNNIALVYDDKGDYDAALKWYHKDLRISEKVLGKDHPDTATTCHNIGTVYFKWGQYEEALQWLNKALSIELRVLGENHPSTKSTKEWIALIPGSH